MLISSVDGKHAFRRGALASFLGGSIVGGVLSAVALILLSGFFSRVPRTVGWLGVGVTASLALARDVGWVRINLPQAARQVPRDIFRRGSISAGLQFGFEMGTGARTYVTSSLPYVAALLVLFHLVSITSAITLGVGFGLARGLIPLIKRASRDCEVWDLRIGASAAWNAYARVLTPVGLFLILFLNLA